MNIFCGMKILYLFFWGHHKIGLYLGVFLCILGVFLMVKVQNGRYFFGLVKFQIFLGVLKIPDIFFFRAVDAGPSLRMQKNESTPSP